MRTIAPGTAVGPYTVESELARGGMGVVYRARRRGDGALVALKILDAGAAVTPLQQERFKREGELAARLAHPGIVRVLDAGAVQWLCYLAMDLIDGAPLGESGRLAPLEAARLMAQVARAVAHAHAHGVVHRDLKPSNVLVRRDDGVALITDFGIARELGSSALTKTGALVGTPTYFSPEQASGRPATAKSDVHALGAILFELLTGAPPFDRPDLPSLLVAINSERPQPPSALAPSVPRSLDRLCLAALEKSPDDRPDAGAFAAELEAIAGGRAEPRASRASWLGIGGGLALVCGALAFVVKPGPTVTPPVEVRPTPARVTTAAPPRRPDPGPVVEPKWLRAVRARGDAQTCLDALDAIAATPPDERTRASAVEVLADHDARWTEPASGDPERDDALDRLLWLHLLWKRLEPAHAPSAERGRTLAGNQLWAFGPKGQSAYQARVGAALVALMPDDLAGYLVYTSATDDVPWTERDGQLLAAGVDLAFAKENGVAWEALSTDLADWLQEIKDRGPAERRGPAREALLELCRSAMTRGPLWPAAAENLLLRGVPLTSFDEGNAFLARAEELTGASSIRSHQVRAEHLGAHARGDAGVLREAARHADRALELLLAAGETHPLWLSRTANLAVDLWRRAREPASAVTTIERALAASAGRQPGLALRRVLLLVELDAAMTAIDAALTDLVARLDAERAARGLDPALLAGALTDARAAMNAPSPARVKELLGRWAKDELVRALDPPERGR